MLCRFVTGDWAAAERRAAAVPGAEGDDEEDDVYGDFEDIEAGLGQTGGSQNISCNSLMWRLCSLCWQNYSEHP